MKGKIWIESEVNEGATFFFTSIFEIAQAAQTPKIPDAKDENVKRPLSILVAEDNTVNQLVITRTLAKLGRS